MMFMAAQVTFIGTRNTSGKTRGLQYCVDIWRRCKGLHSERAQKIGLQTSHDQLHQLNNNFICKLRYI